jgi:hypothetical protein
VEVLLILVVVESDLVVDRLTELLNFKVLVGFRSDITVFEVDSVYTDVIEFPFNFDFSFVIVVDVLDAVLDLVNVGSVLL